VATPFYFSMRYFAKLVSLEGFPEAYGLNLLVFDMRKKIVEQFAIGSGEQSGTFTDFRYREDEHRLTFVVCGQIEEFPIYEISEKVFEVMRRPDNWANLQKGLGMKSEKTVAWLKQRGIYGDESCVQNRRRPPRVR
jgi:hypothetical protein